MTKKQKLVDRIINQIKLDKQVVKTDNSYLIDLACDGWNSIFQMVRVIYPLFDERSRKSPYALFEPELVFDIIGDMDLDMLNGFDQEAEIRDIAERLVKILDELHAILMKNAATVKC